MSEINYIHESNNQLKLKIKELEAKQENLVLRKKVQELETLLKNECSSGTVKTSKKRRTKNAYMFFLQDKRPEIRDLLLSENQRGKVFPQEVCARAGEIWKQMTEELKTPYVQQARSLKENTGCCEQPTKEPSPELHAN